MSEITYLSEIYDNFLYKIADYSLISGILTDEEIEERLFMYFKSAKTRFRKCKKSLNHKLEDSTGEYYIESSLDDFEIEIIVHLMLAEYARLQTLSSEVLKQGLSDKDFKIHSQANQLRELSLLYRQLRKESRKMITEYTFIDFEKERV